MSLKGLAMESSSVVKKIKIKEMQRIHFNDSKLLEKVLLKKFHKVIAGFLAALFFIFLLSCMLLSNVIFSIEIAISSINVQQLINLCSASAIIKK